MENETDINILAMINAAEEINKELGLHPPINVINPIKETITANLLECSKLIDCENDEFSPSTINTLKNLGVKIPTPEIQVFKGTPEQWEKASKLVVKANKGDKASIKELNNMNLFNKEKPNEK